MPPPKQHDDAGPPWSWGRDRHDTKPSPEPEAIGAIPHILVQYLNNTTVVETVLEPPTKRIRLSSQIEDCEHIIVKRSTLLLRFLGSKLPSSRKPIIGQVKDLAVRVGEYGSSTAYRVTIYEDSQRSNRQLLNTTFKADDVPLKDIQLATAVAAEAKSRLNPQGQGRMWTETIFELGCMDGNDHLRLNFTVKWNVMTSFDHLPPRSPPRLALQAILSAYFPAEDRHETTQWLPQDFYDSVFVPDKEDARAASIITKKVETELYPFQKRALRWLLAREGVQWAESAVVQITTTSNLQDQDLPYSFHRVEDAQGQTCYVSHLFNLVTKDIEPFRHHVNKLRGGILAEEMGLGKTVEIIALISLHTRNMDISSSITDPYTLGNVQPTSATLIITPPSILNQWVSELNRHAPSLKVLHYRGIKANRDLTESQRLAQLAASDVVLTTYAVLGAEIHYTRPAPDRQLRHEKMFARPKSPLMQLSWWRVCLDEAQMIESGVSNAATVARLIPRENAWGISGTPVKKDVADLLGILIFLRVEPLVSRQHIWGSLVKSYHSSFQALFKQITLRHTKHLVRDELHLPPQKRYVITMPFTPVEEQHYQSLFEQMCEDCGLDSLGAPTSDNWDPEDSVTIEKMRTWLVRLRQTALHPVVGGRNRRALGNKDGPLRTVHEVLEAMLEQSEVGIRSDQRALHLSLLRRGQQLENGPHVKEALAIWTRVREESSALILECRQQLQHEIDINTSKFLQNKNESESSSEEYTGSDGGNQLSSEVSSKIGTLRSRLRAALEIQHMAIFFCANAYYQIKTNEEMTKPKSPEFTDLENLETGYYEKAKSVRREILREILDKNKKLMRKVAKKAQAQTFVQIPEFAISSHTGGIESPRIVEQLEGLSIALDAQANQLDEWREKTVQFLVRPLVDDDEGLELTGDEYEASTKTQDEVIVYVQAQRTMVEDRFDVLTGQENILIKGEVATALRLAKVGEGAYPERVLELFRIRQQLKPTKDLASVRVVLSDLRALATTLKLDADKGSTRACNELTIVEQLRLRTQKQLSEQIKVVAGIRREIDDFTTFMNTRLEYYRQLQQLSDMVRPFDEIQSHQPSGDASVVEQKLSGKIAMATAKRRYLLHLRDEVNNPVEQRMCVICQSTFELGALTVCGHQFCKDCMGMWWSSHHNCPICKRRLTMHDIYDITYKSQELKVAAEKADIPDQRSPSATSRKSTLYSDISSSTLAEIKDVELPGGSFTTKVDTLARHLIWLREHDPGSKSIIFSQFKDFLDVLGHAFTRFQIGFSTIDKPGGVERFRGDPSTECFLLHAKAHASGLNLVNASHVFLCEPLINTALELQAIARVDRIGQHQATSVYLYLIDGTVEESIYDISVRRRMEHMGQNGKGKSKESTPELLDSNIEAANSLELQQAPLSKLLSKGRTGGELVDKGDLWECLFRNSKPKKIPNAERLNLAVSRHLGAEAAERREI